MKKILLVCACMGLLTAIHAQELPETQIKNLDNGKKVAFNESFEKGKVTLISFWATWCVPCKKEIKNIALKLDGLKKDAGIDFNYMTISIDEVRAEGLARTYAMAQGWRFPYFIDANADLKRSLNFQSVPYTMIIDKNGKVAFTHTGYEEGGEVEIFEKIKELAKK